MHLVAMETLEFVDSLVLWLSFPTTRFIKSIQIQISPAFCNFKMPRVRPTTKLGVYGQYDLNPEQAVTLYNKAKLQNKYYM